MTKLRIGSLFSGYGGLDLAVMKSLDAEVAWHCEWEAAPSKILDKHFPGVPNYRDVTQVDWASIEPVDILTGGFPCQDLSLAGKRAGLKDGTRSGLWSEFAHAIDVIRPRLVVIENVRGLLSATAHSDVEQCSWCMGEGGGNLFCEHLELFSETWPTSGLMRDGRVYALPTQGRLTSDSESSLLPTPTVFHMTMHDEPIDYFLEREAKSSTGQIGKSLGVALRMELLRTPAASEAERGHQPPDVARARGGQVTLSGQASFDDWNKFGPAIEHWEKTTGLSAPEPTLPDGRDGNERLNPAFAEWMMGLPRGWITGCGLSRKDELKACGNGVVPAQAELALSILLTDIKEDLVPKSDRE
jgi:DNA (cytosine-5)-methyltransferase 1